MEKKLIKLEQERNELNVLINKGIEFEIEDTEWKAGKRFFGLVKKYVPVIVMKKFKIQQPTLGTLDRLSAEWIEMAIDEEKIKGDGLKYAKAIAGLHSRRCARIIGLAVLNSDYIIPTPNGYKEDRKRLDELTDLYLRTIKPSKLYELTVYVNTISNLGDFVNSIRLMQSERTTAPDLVEKEV